MTLALTEHPSRLSATDMKAPSGDTRELIHELENVVHGEVRFDAYTRMLYSTDASLYQVQPVGVVLPRDADDIQATVEIAARYKTPLLPRGGGSSLAGQAVGAAIVIDTSKYMDKLVNIELESARAVVQPGMSIAALNNALSASGLMLGPDPASANRATVGGSIGNNATGSHSILYGMMADNVHSVDAILSDASSVRFGPVSRLELDAYAAIDSLEGRIYADVSRLVEASIEEILARWPKHWRRASGYNLDRLAAALMPREERGRLSFDNRFRPPVSDPRRIEHFNLAQLLTGSEGTLGIITQAQLNLVPKPVMTALAVIHFDTVLESCTAIMDVLETEPSASELLDRQLMDLARAQPEWAKKMGFVEGDPDAVLLTEFYGESESELVSKIERLEELMRLRGWKGAIVKVYDRGLQADIWSVRKAGLNLLMSRRGDHKPIPGIEDVSVPQESLSAYITAILEFCASLEDVPDVAVYAHASAGCLHVRPLINVKNELGIRNLTAVSDFACGLAVEYGGIMSGEHGDGYARSSLNPQVFGENLYRTMQEVKHVFDPDRLMNPGKIVDAPSRLENLRMGPAYQTLTLDTVFDWGTDGGYAPAIEMCNGAGVCRKLGAGTMCPSYMATRDEQDTTRGRANALRNAMAGRIPEGELFSPRMKQVMDLCLGCKACKSECPSAVDMAKIKAEYMVHYHSHNGLPLFNRMMGLLPEINERLFRWGRPLIPLVNVLLRSAPAKAVLAQIGVARARTLPAYARRSMEQWFAERQAPAATSAAHGAVVLFHDTWTNFNEPEIGAAAVAVLEAAGYAVELAHGRVCCGRPLITGGQADKAKVAVNHNVALLDAYAQKGIPVVGIEPSCILTLRDEYLNLADDSARAQRVAGNAYTFEEFVVRESDAGRFTAPWMDEPGAALLHGHCHHKAMVGNESSVAALAAAGYRVATIPSGCCGMAGDFGYERSHYAVSKLVAEDRLLPAVRAASGDTVIVASGTSCRHQIGDFSNRQAIHLCQALARALATKQPEESTIL